jgi:hypothetical protein
VTKVVLPKFIATILNNIMVLLFKINLKEVQIHKSSKMMKFTKTLLLSKNKSIATFVAKFFHTQPSLHSQGSAKNVQ